MASPPLDAILTRLQQTLKPRDDSDAADADLLGRFVARRDEEAFESLVWRHGPMVLAVCRRILRDASAAEDAFQAAFLILVRHACAIRKRPSLPSWLHGVAFRVALKARAQIARRRRHEGGTMASDPLAAIDPTHDVDWNELRPVLDAELDRLPHKYRLPFVLCHLEGKTQQETARLLGWRLGTVATRILRGRALLQSRLARRGLAPSVIALAAALAQSLSPICAAPSPALVGLTVRQAARIMVEGAAAVPPHIEHLVAGAVRMTTFTTMYKAMLVALVAVCLGGFGLAWRQGDNTSSAGPAAIALEPEPPRRSAPAPEGPDDAMKKEIKLLEGEWKVSTMEFGKTEVPAEMLTKYKFTFAGDKLTWDAPRGITVKAMKLYPSDGVFPSTFTIDPSQKPKQIDITFHDKKGDRKVMGIYEIKDDTLKLCTGGLRRPTEFSSKDDNRAGYIELKRVKK
jgi:RNA polymerase sigma factor (sigma-70 family)